VFDCFFRFLSAWFSCLVFYFGFALLKRRAFENVDSAKRTKDGREKKGKRWGKNIQEKYSRKILLVLLLFTVLLYW
jgi:hypothetical protein